MKDVSWLGRMLLFFFRRFSNPAMRDHIEGDLLEQYFHLRRSGRKIYAEYRLLADTFSLLRPAFLRGIIGKNSLPHNVNAMIKNYFRSAWRNMVRNKTYSLLNTAGLSAGLTCFILIALWVSDEVSYDKFNSNYERIFRLTSIEQTATGTIGSAVSSAPMAVALKTDYPEIEETVRFSMRNDALVEHKGAQLLQKYILLADPSFFKVFSYRLSKGNSATALKDPYSIILTESTAKKYFGDNDAIGKSITIYMNDKGQGAPYKITGVIKDPPLNAHFRFTMLASFNTIEVANPDLLTANGWRQARFYTYVLLRSDVDHKVVSKKISRFYETYVGNQSKLVYTYQLQPLRDIHLHSNLQREIAPTGNSTQVRIFAIIGILILLLAGINYTNLATARSAGRAKEVGIKKVVGAKRSQLLLQYLSESVFMALTALIVSLLLSFFLQSFFSQVTGKNLSLFSSPAFLLFLLGVTILLGVLSGIYPAAVLAAFRPAITLKGSFKTSQKGLRLRKTLVVSQFAVTIILITGIVVIYKQLSFVKHKDLGYNKDELIFLRLNGNTAITDGYNAFKNELQNSSLIYGVVISNSMIAGGLSSSSAETVDTKGNLLQVKTAQLRVDTGYLNVYDIKLLAGKHFSATASHDSVRQIILNQKAVENFGWVNPGTAIGKPFKIDGQAGTVVGVITDFHFNSLDHAIEPLAIYPLENSFSRITLKVNISKTNEVLAFVEKTWKKHFSAALFDYDFVNRQVEEQYQKEEKFSIIFLYFSILSLVIACLGLYGLISYTIFQKTKEIGIRKVLGASAKRIAVLLSTDFLMLVLLSSFISMPFAWFIMSKWLQNFAYRINLSWWMFAAAGALVLLVALLTVGFQAIKAAVVNPVKSLRTE